MPCHGFFATITNDLLYKQTLPYWQRSIYTDAIREARGKGRAGVARNACPRGSRGWAIARRPARSGGSSDQFPKTSGGILQTPLTPSLFASDEEKVAEGQVRGLPVNPLVVIGKWYQATAGTIAHVSTGTSSQPSMFWFTRTNTLVPTARLP
jgi:hypothetical protein